MKRHQLALERRVVQRSLQRVALGCDGVTVNDAETAAPGTCRRGPSRYVGDGVTGWNGVKRDDVRVVVDDPRIANGQSVEIVRRDHVLQQRALVDDGMRIDETLLNSGPRIFCYASYNEKQRSEQ